MPYKFRTVRQVAELYGLVLEVGGGKHPYKFRGPNGRMYPIPVHGKNEEVPDVYVGGLCRSFGLDLAEFRARLAGGKSKRPPSPPATDSTPPASGEAKD